MRGLECRLERIEAKSGGEFKPVFVVIFEDDDEAEKVREACALAGVPESRADLVRLSVATRRGDEIFKPWFFDSRLKPAECDRHQE